MLKLNDIIFTDPRYSDNFEPYLFQIQGGTGIDPTSMGTSILGKFLIDGEESRFHSNIIGIVKAEEIKDNQLSRKSICERWARSLLKAQCLNKIFAYLCEYQPLYDEYSDIQEDFWAVEGEIDDLQYPYSELQKRIKNFYQRHNISDV